MPFTVWNYVRVASPGREGSTHHMHITPLQQYIEHFYSQFREIRSLLSGALVPWLEPHPRILSDIQSIKNIGGSQVNVHFKVLNLGRAASPCRERSNHQTILTPLQQYIGALLFSILWNKKSTIWVPWSVVLPDYQKVASRPLVALK